jgi:heme/copper-type cytochrome/quinol oxidase subunit 3
MSRETIQKLYDLDRLYPGVFFSPEGSAWLFLELTFSKICKVNLGNPYDLDRLYPRPSLSSECSAWHPALCSFFSELTFSKYVEALDSPSCEPQHTLTASMRYLGKSDGKGFFWEAPTIPITEPHPILGFFIKSSGRLGHGLPQGGIVRQGIPSAVCNTIVLVLSGCSVTWAHFALVARKRGECIFALAMTVCLGLFFTLVQGCEYFLSYFSISDGAYGSCFFMITAFHGVHVVIGTVLILIALSRMVLYHFTAKVHVGLQAAVWYWHFVDLVWVAVFLLVYLDPMNASF